MKKYIIPGLVEPNFEKYPHNPALSWFEGDLISYADLKQHVETLSAWLINQGIKPGDRVALYSTNMPWWGIVYLAVVRIGAVIVPILPDFTGEEATSILQHSKARMVFYARSQTKKLENLDMESYVLEDFFPQQVEVDDAFYQKASEYREELEEDTLAALIYTSGTTGKSKGVMLSHGNLSRNVGSGLSVHDVKAGQNMLSVLPLAHTYECTIGFLLPLTVGAHVVYFQRPPAPALLVKALAEVKPHLMLAVPLLIEKIYRSKILPTFRKNLFMKGLYAFPLTRMLLDRVAGKKLMKTFGGRLEFFGIGGAPLAEDVERFLRRARFPYAIGYGLTETSPLIAGGAPGKFPVHSTGTLVPNLEARLLDDGELQVKGPTVMQGYYDEPQLTAEVLDEDGWFSTGDLCAFDKKGNLFIKGRKKNVIIGSNGENIYPEVLEAIINELPYVQESLVTQRKGQLVAMVHYNYETLKENMEELKIRKEELNTWVEDNLKKVQEQVNKRVGAFSRISEMLEQETPFVRTPTLKIKRFLYQK